MRDDEKQITTPPVDETGRDPAGGNQSAVPAAKDKLADALGEAGRSADTVVAKRGKPRLAKPARVVAEAEAPAATCRKSDDDPRRRELAAHTVERITGAAATVIREVTEKKCDNAQLVEEVKRRVLDRVTLSPKELATFNEDVCALLEKYDLLKYAGPETSVISTLAAYGFTLMLTWREIDRLAARPAAPTPPHPVPVTP